MQYKMKYNCKTQKTVPLMERSARRRRSPDAPGSSTTDGTARWVVRALIPRWFGRHQDRIPVGACFLASLCVITLISCKAIHENDKKIPEVTSTIAPGLGSGLLTSVLQHRRQATKPTGCFWLLACLLLSGDIESNPGPALRVFSQNVRSIKNKLGVLRTHAGELADYSAVCLTETWLAPHVSDSELELGLPDFVWYRKDRNENGGGVACAVKAALSPLHRPDLETDCECLVIQLGVNRPALLAVCYRPPNIDRQVEKVADLLRGLHRSGRPYLLVGDLNLPEISWHGDGEAVLQRRTTRAVTFTDALAEIDAHQSVMSATRGNNILDLAISSGGTAVSDVRDKLFDSDHLVVDTRLIIDIGVPPRPTRSRAHNYKRADFDGLRQALSVK